jgi:DNA-binding beta-propeller fold protein YncE
MNRLKSVLALLLCNVVPAAHGAAQTLLEPIADIAMPNVNGRIDHLALDTQSNLLFVAALGNNTVEVIDLNAKRAVKSISGFGEPQGVLHLRDLNRVYVTNGSANRVDVLDASSLQTRRRLETLDDADNIRYDDAARKVYVGYGKGALTILDPVTEQPAGNIRLSGHPESFQLERAGTRIFVNVPSARHIAVVDREKRAVIATWQTAGAASNYPMALDEATRRLYVGARRPPVMLVYDTTSGNVVGKYPIGEDTDDIFFDAARKRVYVICGEGRVDMFQQESADRYSLIQSSKTWPGARTGLFVAGTSRLYVAAPASATSSARILVYEIH